MLQALELCSESHFASRSPRRAMSLFYPLFAR